MSKEGVTGITEKDLEAKGKASLEKALGEKTQQQKEQTESQSQQPEKETGAPQTQGSGEQTQEPPAQDATASEESELSKFDNILMNTFGMDESEINDKVRKVAKSWAGIQSTATKTKQEAQQYKQYIDQLNGVIEKYPSVGKKLEQAINGQYKENPVSEELKSQPQQSKGQLDYDDVTEDTLISEGYISKDELEGIDDYLKQRKLMRAEAKYVFDKEKSNHLNEIKQQQESLQKQQQADTVKKENEKRATQGFDQFVTTYGVNFAELDDSVMNQIQKRMVVTLDPDDPRKIAEDAFEIAAKSVLPKHGINLQQAVQPSGKSVDHIQDSGKTFSKSTPQQSKKTLADQLRDRARKNAAESNNPKDKFKQTYGNVL